jgi:hypothetical protein
MKKNKPNNKYWIGLMFFAAAFTFVQSLNLYKDIKATSWPVLVGQINWQTHTSGPYRDERYGSIIGSLHWKEVQFSYKVDGLQYLSNNMSFGFTFSDDFELANPYDPEHSAVKIYFNPLNPKEAVLIPGPKTFNICFIVLGAISMFWIFNKIKRARLIANVR